MKIDRIRPIAIAAAVLIATVGGSACLGGSSSAPGDGAGGSAGGTVSGGAAATGNTTSETGGVATTGGSTGASGNAGSPYANVGVCGERSKATADAKSFDGYEEKYIIGEQGFGTDVCAVRFDLKRVGDAPGGCTVCSWTHLVEYSNPSVVTDTDGVCAQSDLALDSTAIGKIVGTRVAIGFAKQLGGAHGSARMKYFENTKTWDVAGNATWDETQKAFRYDFRNGLCNYGP